MFVPDTHYIQNGIGHVGITDNVPGAGFVVYPQVPQHFISSFLGLGSEERGCARGMVGASTDACLEWVGVGDAVAEVCNYVAVVPPGHDTIGGVRVLECLTCRWAVVYGIEIQANPNTRGGNEEKRCKALYNMLYNGNLQVEDTGYVKIFEFVDGATITGKAPDGTEVKISNSIMTNQGRLFAYTQTATVENGTYRFVVPYSTLGPIPDETNFDTRPIGPYTITSEDVSKTVDVAEQDVLDGGTVTVNLE